MYYRPHELELLMRGGRVPEPSHPRIRAELMFARGRGRHEQPSAARGGRVRAARARLAAALTRRGELAPAPAAIDIQQYLRMEFTVDEHR